MALAPFFRIAAIGVLCTVACTQPSAVSVPAAAHVVVTHETPTTPWNVILVTIDTLRGDVLGYAGGAAHTPRFDAFANSSWEFSRCISASMLTNPSHASILTALYPHEHGVYSNDVGIADGMPTLATALQQQGYHTGAVIGFAHLNPTVANLGQGFARVIAAPAHERRAAQTTAAGLALIDALGPGPFFTWLHYTDPHAPYEPASSQALRALPHPSETSMAHARSVAPRFQRDNPWFHEAYRSYANPDALVTRYLAEVEAVDTALGQLLDGLVARGRATDTLIVVTADHGENLGEHDLYFHHGGLYEATVHVPLLMHVPGQAARHFAQLVQSIDIAPTVMALLHKTMWQPQSGVNLLPYVQGGAAPRTYVFSEHMFNQLVAVRSADATLIVHRKSSDQFPSYPFVQGRQEFYHSGSDPQELRALPATHDPAALPLQAALRNFLQDKTAAHAPRIATQVDRDGLRSLGYTQ